VDFINKENGMRRLRSSLSSALRRFLEITNDILSNANSAEIHEYHAISQRDQVTGIIDATVWLKFFIDCFTNTRLAN
jgi:hypothetical protein